MAKENTVQQKDTADFLLQLQLECTVTANLEHAIEHNAVNTSGHVTQTTSQTRTLFWTLMMRLVRSLGRHVALRLPITSLCRAVTSAAENDPTGRRTVSVAFVPTTALLCCFTTASDPVWKLSQAPLTAPAEPTGGHRRIVTSS